jgi:hypothetical protein
VCCIYIQFGKSFGSDRGKKKYMNLRYKMTLNHKFSLEKNNIGQDSNFRFKKWKTIHLQSILVPRTFYPIWLKYTITKVNYLWSDTNMLTSGMKLRRSWVSASFRSRIQTVSATCVLFLLFTSPLVLSSTFLYLSTPIGRKPINNVKPDTVT